jgi:hypothetical protein
METIKVRITKAEPSYWYADKIGQVFQVISENYENYRISQTRCICKKDCEIVEPSLNDRFEPLTSGGYEFHLYEEFEGRLFGRVSNHNGVWSAQHWTIDGYLRIDKNVSSHDLIPRKSPETIALENRKAELQEELKEIENKLKEK